VNAVVSYIADTQRYASHARGIAIDVMLATEAPRVLGDPAQLEQVILHLMVNARQALELRLSHAPSTPDVSRPLISLQTTVTPSQVAVEIVDTGTGIAPTDLAHIWDPFWTSREEGEGTGLGLSVVNSIVVSHGGAIAVKSEVDRGSHFVITLPRMDAMDTGAMTAETKARQPLDILVVDDEPVLRDLLTRFFSERGHAVMSAEGGEAALRLASQVAFDVVICDFHMPGLDGCQLVHRLRAAHGARATRYFLASGDTLLSASTVDAGVDALIDKPYNLDEVLALVESTGGAAPSRESA
jgi:CheY-like chemotaxis protein